MSKCIDEFYVVYGTSESGDDYVLGLYFKEPTEDELSAIVRLEAEQEIDADDNVSYLRPQIRKVEVRDLPQPDPNPVRYL